MESSGVNIAAWLTCDLYQLVGNGVSMDGQNIPNDLPQNWFVARQCRAVSNDCHRHWCSSLDIKRPSDR